MCAGRSVWAAVRWVVACGGLSLAVTAAQAGDFSVGRVEVTFAEDGWTEIPLSDSKSVYGGEKEGAFSVKSKLYVRGESERGNQVLVLVSATTGGVHGGYVTYSPDCQPDEHNFREGNTGIRRPFAQCLVVTPRYSSESVFRALAPRIQEQQAAGRVSQERPVFTLWSYYAISSGETLDVRVFSSSPLAVVGAFIPQALPPGIPAEHVDWGRQLAQAVKSSVLSISGRLVVPAIRLAESETGAPGKSAGVIAGLAISGGVAGAL